MKESGMRVEIYSDMVCPWCFIGKRRWEHAMETAGYANHVQVTWRPFQLNPTMPKSGMDRRTYIEAKFGGAEGRREIEERLAKAGVADGIMFAFDRIARTPNTFEAHRLMWFSQQHKKQDDLAEGLFHAYFSEGRDIGEGQTLVDIAAEIGLDRDTTRQFLASDQGVEVVREEEATGHGLGIRGVPYFVLNGTYAISGAQSPDIFVSALQKVEADCTDGKAGR
ncbi:MAG TPA: DsbA family oxidoreductase [Nitrospiraceae bacterium]|nr:DsbA family oxidoreductase [Nitrospiraceae bacterium]